MIGEHKPPPPPVLPTGASLQRQEAGSPGPAPRRGKGDSPPPSGPRYYRFYHRTTGIIHPSQFSVDGPEPDECAARSAPPDHLPIVGRFDHLAQRIDLETGQVVDYQPPAPSADEHEWNATTKRWQLTAAAIERRGRREAALAQITALEGRTLRAMRELLCSPGDMAAQARLHSLEDQIRALRQELA
jgi:hypothetical protein